MPYPSSGFEGLYCDVCEMYHHKSDGCAPRFVVWCPDQGHEEERDGTAVHALLPEDAAEKWVSAYNSQYADYVDERTVMVRRSDGSAPVRYRVTLESVPLYTARPA